MGDFSGTHPSTAVRRFRSYLAKWKGDPIDNLQAATSINNSGAERLIPGIVTSLLQARLKFSARS
jgi:hypothetical protein